MKNSEKGITMVALVIMIIVMIIISGIIIYEGTSTIKSAKQQSIITNMLLIQAKARTIADKKEFQEISGYIGHKIEDTQIKDKLNITEENEVWSLSQSELYEMGVEVSGDNKYAVDYKNDEVYYLKGIEDKDGNIYYSLSEISVLELNEEDIK